jgi:16S rRNA (cytosine1402-N4)-methyltransferase
LDAVGDICQKFGLSDLPPNERPKRRKRYAGKNPRRFEDKYKELAPKRYADDMAKIMASGKTPAGTHRPIMVDEIMDCIAAQPGEIAVDCTLGYGGHSRILVEALQPGGKLYGLDVDPIEQPRTEQRLRDAGHGSEAFQVRHMNFAGLPKLLAQEQLEGLDIVIADLGVSSMQIDNPERGFTFKADGPLDLRLNPSHGQSAAALLAKIPVAKLATLLIENADEPQAELLAKSILLAQKANPITRTRQLAVIIQAALEHSGENISETDITDTQRRVFQALRIAINDEFGALDSLLRVLPSSLNPGGRVAILTFHSGEDRRVKKAFQVGVREGIYSSVSEKVIRASFEERHANPRSTSAKLRWAIRASSLPIPNPTH